jgi:hypothetical protein
MVIEYPDSNGTSVEYVLAYLVLPSALAVVLVTYESDVDGVAVLLKLWYQSHLSRRSEYAIFILQSRDN